MARDYFDIQKKNDFGERSSLFFRCFKRNGGGNIDTRVAQGFV